MLISFLALFRTFDLESGKLTHQDIGQVNMQKASPIGSSASFSQLNLIFGSQANGKTGDPNRRASHIRQRGVPRKFSKLGMKVPLLETLAARIALVPLFFCL